MADATLSTRVSRQSMWPGEDAAKPPPEPDPLVTLSFYVHRDFRRRFKLLALDADVTQKELLHRAVDALEREQAREAEG